ncbi:MAG: hypothetical protein WDO14_10675 [Bacteroidota bacterium]
MKRILLIGILYSITAVSIAQTVIEKVWTTGPTVDGLQELDTRINKLVASLEKHHYRTDKRKLQALFLKTHGTFLHSYVQYTGIEGLAKGRYDCLTATSLFADILTRVGYDFKIVETNYHIFVMVNTSEGEVLLETTDKLGGFIDDEKRMIKVIEQYKKNVSLYTTVNIDELPGLLYFNQAVKAFNAAKWDECSQKLSAAAKKTNSPQIAELAAMLHRQPYFSGR